MRVQLRILLLAAVLAVFLVAGPARAESPQTLAELIALGLESNLGLQIQQLQVERSQQDVIVEDAAFDPQIFATAGYSQSTTAYESPGLSDSRSESDSYSAELGVSQELPTGLNLALTAASAWSSDEDLNNDLDPSYRTSLRLDLTQPLLRGLGRQVNSFGLQSARNRQRQSALEQLLQAQQLALQIEILARQLVGQSAIVQLRQDSLELARQLYQANQKRYETGLVPVSEVQEAETAQADRQLSLSLAEQSYDHFQETLQRQVNYALPVDFTVEELRFEVERLTYRGLEEALAEALKQRLDLQINEYAIATGQLRRLYQDNQTKPRLDLKVGAGLNGLSGSDRGLSPGSEYSGPWLDSATGMTAPDGYEWRATVEFSMPWGNREAQARARQATLQLKQEQRRQQDLRDQVKQELRQQEIELNRTAEQLRIAKHFASLARTSLDQEYQRLQAGLSDTFRVLTFQENMVNAQIGQVNAQVAYQLARARLDFARGRIFERYWIELSPALEN